MQINSLFRQFHDWTFQLAQTLEAKWSKWLKPIIAAKNKKRPPVRGYTYLDGLLEALTFDEFEPESLHDYLVLPYYLLCWFIAYTSTHARAQATAVKYLLTRKCHGWRESQIWAYGWSRRNSPEPIACPRCLWMGAQHQCYHGYTEWEAQDECPKCGRCV